MKSQTKVLVAFCAGLLSVCGTAGFCFGEQKKDVSDPVLNEVIQNFGPRMPRFIDKHGKDVFVTDAPVTRGSLMLALYEYDKSLKLPKKDFVSRQEFEELSARLSTLELEPEGKHRAKDETEKGPTDMTQIINDLMPNMPVLLDNSLNNSKVFNNLREEVMNRKSIGGAENDVSSAGLDQTRYELGILTKKVEVMERTSARESVGGTDSSLQYLKKDLTATRSQLARLEKRIDGIEQSGGEGRTASRTSSSSDDVKSYTSALAKISMGLSMVAALFIAR